MLDVVAGRRQDALIGAGQPPLQLPRVEASKGPVDRDDGNINIRKDIRRGAHDRDPAHDENHQRQYNECIGPIESNSEDPHDWVSILRKMAVSFAWSRTGPIVNETDI